MHLVSGNLLNSDGKVATGQDNSSTLIQMQSSPNLVPVTTAASILNGAKGIGAENMTPLDEDDKSANSRGCFCSRSQCLKLYCDCFASGKSCDGCRCTQCRNNSDTSEEFRDAVIRQVKARNPNAFKPKIGNFLTFTDYCIFQQPDICVNIPFL